MDDGGTRATAMANARLLNEAVADTEHNQNAAEPVSSSNHDSSVAADCPPTDCRSTSENLEGGIDQNNSEPATPNAEGDLIERLFCLLQRAIDALDAQVETRCSTQYNSIVLLDQKLSDLINARTGRAMTVEPPPLISAVHEQEPDIETKFADEFDSTLTPSIESIQLSTRDTPLGSLSSRLQMLTIMENARRSQCDAIGARHVGYGDLRIRLVEITAATFAVLLIIAALLWVHDRAHATEAPAKTAIRWAPEPGPVALMNTTGFSEKLSNAYAPTTSSLAAQASGGSGPLHAKIP